MTHCFLEILARASPWPPGFQPCSPTHSTVQWSTLLMERISTHAFTQPSNAQVFSLAQGLGTPWHPLILSISSSTPKPVSQLHPKEHSWGMVSLFQMLGQPPWSLPGQLGLVFRTRCQSGWLQGQLSSSSGSSRIRELTVGTPPSTFTLGPMARNPH